MAGPFAPGRQGARGDRGLGYARVPGSHAEYYVPDERVEDIKSVIVDLNELFRGSLWIWWWDSEKPGAPGERWYPEGLTR